MPVPTRKASQRPPPPDWRHIAHGREIPTESYSDQPYLVRTDDGAWLCALTTGPGHEGSRGQHVVTMRSADQGRTWSAPNEVEPSDGPEASYAVLLKAPGGRIYVFYNHNTDNVRRVKADNPPYETGYCARVDSLGYFVFKYSDDHGRTWSRERFPIAVREFEIDRRNADGGRLRYFWNVGRPFIHEGSAYVPLHKVGGFGHGFFTSTEGVLLRSPNLLTEADPRKISFETLPEGERGLRAPEGGGPIAEEHSFSVLGDGTFHVVFRTIDGHPACARSRDRGRTWTPSRYQTFADGRRMKHPRAANFAWRLRDGRFLYWFHNHGGTWYDDRNPVWVCGGVEAEGSGGRWIAWSQPEILLYDDDPFIRMSYPDLIEEEGRVFLTETQKDIARVHEVHPSLLAALWPREGAVRDIARGGLLLALGDTDACPRTFPAPPLPPFVSRDEHRPDYGQKDLRQGFSVELWFRLSTPEAGQVLVENRDPAGKGFALATTGRGAVEIILNDGRTENRWACDPGVIETGRWHHLVAIVDGGPKIITFVVDGRFCDGGTHRQFGWGRFSPNLRDVNGSETLRIAPDATAVVREMRIYGRHLLTAEAAGNFEAGPNRPARE